MFQYGSELNEMKIDVLHPNKEGNKFTVILDFCHYFIFI